MKTYELCLIVTKHINCLSFKQQVIVYYLLSDDSFIRIKIAIRTYLK